MFASHEFASVFKHLINSPIRKCGLRMIELNLRFYSFTALLVLVYDACCSMVVVQYINWNVWIVQPLIHEVIKYIIVSYLRGEPILGIYQGESKGKNDCC